MRNGRSWLVRGGTALVLAVATGATVGKGQQRPCTAELVVLSAKVHTVDAGRPSAQAVAVCRGLIARVGTNDEVKALAGPSTRVVDAGGRLVVPGFNDSHVHLIDGANEVVGVDLRPAKTVDEMAR